MYAVGQSPDGEAVPPLSLLRLEGGRWRVVPLPDEVWCLTVAASGDAWVSTPEGIFRVEEGQPVPAPWDVTPPGAGLFDRAPQGMAFLAEDDIWLGWGHGRVSHWDGREWSHLQTRTRDQQPGSTLNAFIADRRGRAWRLESYRAVEVLHRRSVRLHISSGWSENRVAFSALSEVCARIADRLGGVAIAT